MITIISPTTTMDFSKNILATKSTTPIFHNEANYLINLLKDSDEEYVSSLMSLSSELTSLNVQRYKNFGQANNQKVQSILAFSGEVFSCMDVSDFSDVDFTFANNHIKILSGLYGSLSPLDLIEPYRLEMKAKLNNHMGDNLYKFWKEKITDHLSSTLECQNNPILVNLASSEYLKSIDLKSIRKNYKFLDVVFKDYNSKSQTYKVLGLYSKKARGYMVRYIIKNKIDNIDKLKEFNEFGYTYNSSLSTEDVFVFTR